MIWLLSNHISKVSFSRIFNVLMISMGIVILMLSPDLKVRLRNFTGNVLVNRTIS